MSWFDNKELLLGADTVIWNSFKKKSYKHGIFDNK